MHPTHRRLPRSLLSLGLLALFSASGLAAPKPAKSELRKAERNASTDATDAKVSKREEKLAAKAAGTDAADAESPILTRLRKRLEVTDDAEWAVIAARITKVEELRRPVAPAGNGARDLAATGDKVKRNARAGASANPEFDALRAAVVDQSTDAEIKARLARAHEVYQQREAQLEKAQADLRAVLTVRQEAVVVMFGLLPP